MCLAVGEKPVEDQAEDREEEDDDAPEQLVRGRAVGLEDFHYRSLISSILSEILQVFVGAG